MQKQNTKRSSHERIGAVILMFATLAGGLELGKHQLTHQVATAHPVLAFSHALERESETGRHMVRFDEVLRPPTTSGQ